MGAEGEPQRIGKQTIRCGLLAALVLLMPAFCWVVWGTPVGPLGQKLAYPFFSHPPASVDKPPLLPNAQNVKTEQGSEGKTISYNAKTDPNSVYDFYKDALVKDGWGGDGYFSKPKLTDQGMNFEWDQTGLNGCEGIGYTLRVLATKTAESTTYVLLELAQINPC
jgi:hypothetical protein